VHVIGCPNKHESLPLVRAIETGDYNLFRLILGRYNPPMTDQSYVAFAAAMYCLIPCDSRAQLDFLRALCIHGADAEDVTQKQARFKSPDPEGNCYATALHAAASRYDNDAIKILLECSADGKAVDNEGITALQVYSDKVYSREEYLEIEDLDTVQMLLDLDDDKSAMRLGCGLRERIIATLVLDPSEVGQFALSLYLRNHCTWRMAHHHMMSPLHFAAETGIARY
jgi:hypothetical protein